MPSVNPEVSVVIPMFNARETIAHAIGSVAASTLGDLEIIVVNDGSTDDSPVIVEALAMHEPRLRQVHQKNRGLPGARNAGIEQARGRHVYFLDADDWVLPDGLRLLVEAARRAGTPGAYGGFQICAARGDVVGVESATLPSVGLGDLLDLHFVVTHSLLLRRDALEHPSPLRFDEACTRVEDYDLWFRLAERGVRWAAAGPAPVCAYRIAPKTLSTAHGAMLHGAQSVVSRAFARARAGKFTNVDPGTIDASTAYESDRLSLIALNWATRAVITQGVGCIDEAGRLFLNAMGRKTVDPQRAAGCVLGAILVGLGQPATIDGRSETQWAPRAMAWWDYCVERGWGRPGLPQKAAAALAEQSVTPAVVIDAILDRALPARAVTLLGFGRNGRALAARALERGFRVNVRDDRFADGVVPEAQSMSGVAGEPMHAPVPEGHALVATPLDDGSLASRFATAENLIRWTDVRRSLAGDAAQRLLSCKMHATAWVMTPRVKAIRLHPECTQAHPAASPRGSSPAPPSEPTAAGASPAHEASPTRGRRS